MSSYTSPTVTDFKDYFVRDFPYGATLEAVTDADITRGLSDAGGFINPSFFDDQGGYQVGYLYLAAHFLVMNIRASSQGVAGKFAWIENSKSVGSVSHSVSIPQRILDNPELSILAETNYGVRYLFLVLPQLSGQMYTVAGWTHP